MKETFSCLKSLEMMSEKEKELARELLSRIDLQDLITLTDTVSNRAVSTENRKEAIEAILLYSVNATQLLRRKKVKREHLYKYLAEKGYVEPVTADKSQLCRKVLQLWGQNEFDRNTVGSFDEDDQDCAPLTPPEHHQEASNQSKQNTLAVIDGQALASEFIPWFNGILNSLDKDTSEWGEHHFWNDAKCNITMLSEQHIHEECQGSPEVCAKIGQLVTNEKLYFNVNPSSIKGEMNNYSLVRILACGTVHRFESCIGIFEQSFGLIRDPHANNNWKIKFINLRLKSQSTLQGKDTMALGANGEKLAITN